MEEKIDKRTREYRDGQVRDAAEAKVAATAPAGEKEGVAKVETLDLRDPVEVKLDEILSRITAVEDALTEPKAIAPPPIKESSRPQPTKPVGDLSKCMKCGNDLPPTETPRRIQELCNACVWRKSKKAC